MENKIEVIEGMLEKFEQEKQVVEGCIMMLQEELRKSLAKKEVKNG